MNKMKITYKPSPRREIVRLHCPVCGERYRNVGLDPENCSITGLTFRCKRCREYRELTVETDSK